MAEQEKKLQTSHDEGLSAHHQGEYATSSMQERTPARTMASTTYRRGLRRNAEDWQAKIRESRDNNGSRVADIRGYMGETRNREADAGSEVLPQATVDTANPSSSPTAVMTELGSPNPADTNPAPSDASMVSNAGAEVPDVGLPVDDLPGQGPDNTFQNVPTDLQSQEVDPMHMVEATLVQEDSFRNNNAEEGAIIPEAEIVSEQSLWHKCAPKSKSGKAFCVLALLTIAGVATTGIVCGSGMCSPSNDGNIGSDFDPDVVVYNPSFIRLPNNTIEALKNSSSPQGRAYRWMEENAEVYELSTRVEWRKHQLFGMATLFYAMDGEEWEDKQLWLRPPEAECDWMPYGDAESRPIGCVGFYDNPCEQEEAKMLVAKDLPCDYGVLTSLDLTDVPTGRTTPPEIELLSSLKTLSIIGTTNADYEITTKVEYILPSQIGNLQALTQLNLVHNLLTGKIPTFLGTASSLISLNLIPRNELTGQLPSELGQLENLTYLDLGGNALTGPIPSQLGRMNALSYYLQLSGNALTGPIPTEMGQLEKLTVLGLSFNSLTGPIPTELGQLEKMTALGLSGKSLTGQIPSESGLLMNYMDPSNNFLTGQIPTELGLLEWGVPLRLYNNSFTGTVPDQVCESVREGIKLDCDEVTCPNDCPCECWGL